MDRSVKGLTQPYPNVRRNADRVVTGLAGLPNSNGPTICPHCFELFPLTVIPNQSYLLRLRAECPALFDSCLTGVLTWFNLHSADEWRRILARNSSTCPVHRSKPPKPELYPEMFYTTAYLIVAVALGKGENSPSERAHSNKNFSDRLGRWPSKISQIFPLGEQETVEALLAFCETYTCPAPLLLLAELLVIARSIVWPVLVSKRNRRRLVFLIITLLNPPEGPDCPRWLAGTDYVEQYAKFMGNLRIGPNSRDNEFRQLLGDVEEVRILYCAVAAALERLPESDKAVPEFALWCHIVYHAVPEGTIPQSLRARRWTEENLQRQRPSLARSLESTISLLVRVRACAFCGISSIRKEDGKALSLCAGCKLLLYCSKACQKQHWQGTGGRSPHKAVCKIIRRIDGISTYTGQEPGEKERLTEAFREIEPDLAADELEVVKDWLFDTRLALGDDSAILQAELGVGDEWASGELNSDAACINDDITSDARAGEDVSRAV